MCPMSHFQSPTIQLSLNHLRLVHGSDPRFSVQCGIDGCSYTAHTFSALYSHIYRTHPKCGVIRKRDSRSSELSDEGEAEVAIGPSESFGIQDFETQGIIYVTCMHDAVEMHAENYTHFKQRRQYSLFSS